MKKPGKQFEEDFKKSVPPQFWFYRFKDSPASFNMNNECGNCPKNKNPVRFALKNICDYQLYAFPNLFQIELKSTNQKSLSFGNVRDNQIKELGEAAKFKGIHAGFIVNFRSVNETYYLPVDNYAYYVVNLERKSIPIDEFRKTCIRIGQNKLQKHWRYNVSQFVEEVQNGVKNSEITLFGDEGNNNNRTST